MQDQGTDLFVDPFARLNRSSVTVPIAAESTPRRALDQCRLSPDQAPEGAKARRQKKLADVDEALSNHIAERIHALVTRQGGRGQNSTRQRKPDRFKDRNE